MKQLAACLEIIALSVLLALSGCSMRGKDEILSITASKHPGFQAQRAIELEVRIKIKKDWHINAHDVADQFMVPTYLEMSPGPFAAGPTAYPPPTKRAEIAGIKMQLYDGSITIIVPVVLRPDFMGNKIEMRGELNYQPCDNLQCLEPRKTGFYTKIDLQ